MKKNQIVPFEVESKDNKTTDREKNQDILIQNLDRIDGDAAQMNEFKEISI